MEWKRLKGTAGVAPVLRSGVGGDSMAEREVVMARHWPVTDLSDWHYYDHGKRSYPRYCGKKI